VQAQGEVRRFTDGSRILGQASEALKAAVMGLRRASGVATVNMVRNVGPR
jgi:hypothetical protein